MHVCARCPKALGTSCCQVKDDEQLATLTWADVARIEEATGHRGFTEFEWLDPAAAARWAGLHPAWGSYFGLQTRRLTLKRVRGACVFLKPDGCALTPAQRPTACRLYPFEVRASGDWGLQVDRFGGVPEALAAGEHACLAVEEADSFDALFAALGTDRATLEALAGRLRQEARAHARVEGSTRGSQQD